MSHALRKHKPMSASKIGRLLACPASYYAVQGVKEERKAEANQGEKCHELIEAVIKGEDIGVQLIENLNAVNDAYRIFQEMRGLYPQAKYKTEVALEVDEYIGGTFDLVMLDIRNKYCVVHDWKFGKFKEVAVEDNAQLLTGCACMYHRYPELEVFHTSIYQRDYSADLQVKTYSKEEIAEFYLKIIRLRDDILAKRVHFAIGEHCQFCPGIATCPEHYVKSQELTAPFSADFALPEVSTLSLEQFANIVRYGSKVTKFIESALKHAKDLAKSGVDIPEHKLVRGARNEKWLDDENVVRDIWAEFGIDIAKLSKLTPAQARALIPEDQHEALAKHIKTSFNAPQFVKLSDKRPALAVTVAKEDFNDELNED